MIQERTHKGERIVKALDNYTVIDIETTGFSSNIDEIIEVAAIRVRNGDVVEQFQSIIKPKQDIDAFITKLTGITNDMVEAAPSLEMVLPLFIDFIGDDIVVAHNAGFDINFIYDVFNLTTGIYFSNDFIDTVYISRRLFKEYSKHTLLALTKHFGICGDIEHRALSDARKTFECYEYMKKYCADSEIDFDLIECMPVKAGKSTSVNNITTSNTCFDENTPVFGKVFVFTGELDMTTRGDAMQLVVDMGGLCQDNVTKETNYLVLGSNDYCKTIKDGKSSKHKKAEKMISDGFNIQIISENFFYDMAQDLYKDADYHTNKYVGSGPTQVPKRIKPLSLEDGYDIVPLDDKWQCSILDDERLFIETLIKKCEGIAVEFYFSRENNGHIGISHKTNYEIHRLSLGKIKLQGRTKWMSGVGLGVKGSRIDGDISDFIQKIDIWVDVLRRRAIGESVW